MSAKYIKTHITKEKLDNEPNNYFVFGDSFERKGIMGASSIREHPRAISFITKKKIEDTESSCFKAEEYIQLFFIQLDRLAKEIKNRENSTFYISKLGSGGANKHNIWSKIIRPNLIETLEKHDNVVFCWNKEDEPILDISTEQHKYEKIEMSLDDLNSMKI